MQDLKDTQNPEAESVQPTTALSQQILPKRDHRLRLGFKPRGQRSNQTSSNSLTLSVFSFGKTRKKERKKLAATRNIYSTPQASFLLHNAVDFASEVVAAAKPQLYNVPNLNN